jgi:Dolichyl-phosphate-mannose-protein mannosyltransferase
MSITNLPGNAISEPRMNLEHESATAIREGTLWQATESRPPTTRSWHIGLVLCLAASFIVPGISRGEFHWNIDEAFHATTGLFFADFFHDLPLSHPIQYAYHYYAQYPALGIVHWPPLFYMVEGLMFTLFGANVVAARATVLLFALFGLTFWFRLVCEIDNEWTAAVSTLVLAGLPSLLLYEKSVMLEIPSLALCIAAIYYWICYLSRGHKHYAYWFGLFAGLALLAKQQSIFLAPTCLLTIAATHNWKLLISRPMIVALAICAAISAPFYFLSLGVDGKSITANVARGVEKVLHPFYYYPRLLPGQLGTAFLILSLLGIATWPWWRKKALPSIMLAWIVGWYVTYTALGTKTPRYIVYWLPPFIYFLVAPLASKELPRLVRPVAVGVLAVIVGVSSWMAWTYQRPYVSGYDQVAREVVHGERAGVVLFDGDLAGNFIFFMRAEDPHRRFVVLRKALFVTQVMSQFGSQELIHSQADLEKLFGDYGIKYVVVEKNTPLQFSSQKILRDFLQTSRFRLVEERPIQSNVPEWNQRSLQLYEDVDAAPPTETVLHLKMLSMDHDIVEPLDSYLKR